MCPCLLKDETKQNPTRGQRISKRETEDRERDQQDRSWWLQKASLPPGSCSCNQTTQSTKKDESIRRKVGEKTGLDWYKDFLTHLASIHLFFPIRSVSNTQHTNTKVWLHWFIIYSIDLKAFFSDFKNLGFWLYQSHPGEFRRNRREDFMFTLSTILLSEVGVRPTHRANLQGSPSTCSVTPNSDVWLERKIIPEEVLKYHRWPK